MTRGRGVAALAVKERITDVLVESGNFEASVVDFARLVSGC
jgi:hypothetical protein